MKIGILNKIINPDIEMKTVPKDVEIVCLNACDESVLKKHEISQFDAVIVSYKFKLSRSTIDNLINCKAIVSASVGYDNIDYRYAAQKGIRVFNVPDYGTNDVADHTIALFLSYARRVSAYDSAIKQGGVSNWNPRTVQPFHRLSDKNIGIIGLGRIGTAVALRAKAFGMNVLYYDPYKPNGYDKVYQFKKVKTLSQLFEESDVVSIHAPLTLETEGLVGWNIIKQSKRCPIIINTARGGIVDSNAIVRGLIEGVIDAFLADVVHPEPPLESDVLFSLQKTQEFSTRIILTPHAASYAEESQYEMRYKSAQHAYMAVVDDNYIADCINVIGGVSSG